MPHKPHRHHYKIRLRHKLLFARKPAGERQVQSTDISLNNCTILIFI